MSVTKRSFARRICRIASRETVSRYREVSSRPRDDYGSRLQQMRPKCCCKVSLRSSQLEELLLLTRISARSPCRGATRFVVSAKVQFMRDNNNRYEDCNNRLYSQARTTQQNSSTHAAQAETEQNQRACANKEGAAFATIIYSLTHVL